MFLNAGPARIAAVDWTAGIIRDRLSRNPPFRSYLKNIEPKDSFETASTYQIKSIQLFAGAIGDAIEFTH